VSAAAVGMLVLFWIVMAASTGSAPMQFARMLVASLAPLVVVYLVILMALRYQAVAVVVALAGVAVTGLGLWYLVAALSPENRVGNQWYELGVLFGAAGTLAGGVLIALGVWTGIIAAKRKRARSSPAPRSEGP
jgi:pilus assembly protein TadC